MLYALIPSFDIPLTPQCPQPRDHPESLGHSSSDVTLTLEDPAESLCLPTIGPARCGLLRI